MRVELITIGTELLMGFVLNTHAAYLGKKLTGIGASLVRQVCVNDTGDEIRTALESALAEADVVITTGGLGPTSDDITRDLVIQMLQLKTHKDLKALENIEARFRRRSLELPEIVKSQAIVPDAARVLYNEHGTAPGLAIPLSSVAVLVDRGIGSSKTPRCKWLIMLPGPPRELKPMFEEQVLPLLEKEFQGNLPVIDCRVFKVVGMGESSVADRIEPVLKGIEGLEIGYCARIGEVDVRLVLIGKEQSLVQAKADDAEEKVRRVLDQFIYAKGDFSLEEVVVNLLCEKQKCVVTAESCTGGYLANRITMISGSSKVFKEGWVTYSNEAKVKMLGVPGHLIIEHGAVSEPVAKSMAETALEKSGADYALAITGIAGPTGGTEEKPVGTVFIGLASRKGTTVEKFRYPMDRETFKFVTSQTALNLLRKDLLSL
jgi:nicotinamide-nucleotide amidase